MNPYCFFANRQLIFYVSINGQQKLVRFGERDTFGVSAFQTTNRYTAEAIRKTSLFKKGVIKEESKVEEKKPATVIPAKKAPVPEKPADPTITEPTEPTDNQTTTGTDNGNPDAGNGQEVIEAKNFTQAKSILSKKLNIKYNDIKTPDQLMKLASEANITINYVK